MEIVICRDFSETPNARYRAEGPDSGEEFRESLLEPKYILAINSNQKLIINLDGAYGYPTSFLEEAFGGLARKYGSAEVADTLEFISEDEYVEITPLSIRMRKKVLDPSLRRKIRIHG